MSELDGCQWIDQNEVGIRLGISPRTLARWRSEKTGPPWVRLGGAIRYRVSDLDAWADDQMVIRPDVGQ